MEKEKRKIAKYFRKYTDRYTQQIYWLAKICYIVYFANKNIITKYYFD